MEKAVVAVFNTLGQARDAVADLEAAGFDQGSISLVTADRSGEIQYYSKHELDVDRAADQKMTTGTGALVGAISGLLVGMTLVTVPGIGPVLAAGSLATSMSATAAGAVAGTLSGALVAAGIPKDEADLYVLQIVRGGTLVAVHMDQEDADRATEVLDRHNPTDIESEVTPAMVSTTQQMGSFETRAPLPLAVDLSISDVHATKPSIVSVPGDEEEVYRSHFTENFSAVGESYEDYYPGYQYGYSLVRDERFRNRAWEDLLPQVRYHWEAAHPEKPWSKYEQAIHTAWQRASNQ